MINGSFQQLINLISHLPKSKILASKAVTDGQYKFYLSGKKHSKINQTISNTNAIIMGDGGVASVDFATGRYSYSSHNFGFFSKNKSVKSEYIFRTIENFLPVIDYKGFVGSGLKNIDKKFLFNLYIQIPSIEEQHKIISSLASVDKTIENTQKKLNKTLDLKKATMNKLITRGISHKDFQHSDLEKIVKGSEVKKLSECMDKIIDCEHKTAPKVEYSNYWVVSTNAVKDGKIIEKELYNTSKNSYETWTEREIPQEGDVMFTREAPAGESCYITNKKKVCLGQRMVLMRPSKKIIDGQYLNYFLNTDIGKKNTYLFSIGTTVSRINMQDIKKLKIIVPTLNEQRKIVHILSSLDETLNEQERLLKKIQLIKKSLMQNLLKEKVRISSI